MEGNKNIRPSTPSPSIKRTPTVKRGPVPPRVSKSPASESSKSPSKPSSVVTKGAPKISSSSRGKVSPSPGRSSVPTGGGEKSKKKGLIIGVIVGLLVLLGGVLFAPIFDGKSLMSGISTDRNSNPKNTNTGDIIIVDDEAEAASVDDEVTSTDDALIVGGDEEDGLELSGDEDLISSGSTDEDLVVEEIASPSSSDINVPVSVNNDPLDVDEGMITNRTGKHYVIVGSFAVKQNAYNLKKKLGSGAQIIAPYSGSNLYKVATNQYSSLDQANQDLEANMEKYGVDIWILSF